MHPSLAQIVSAGCDESTMLFLSGNRLVDYLVNGAEYAATEATQRVRAMHSRLFVAEVTHYAIEHDPSPTFGFRRKPCPTPRRELLIFHISLTQEWGSLPPTPVGTIIVECFHGDRLEKVGCFRPVTPLTIHGDTVVHYRPFCQGEITLDVYGVECMVPRRQSRQLVSEQFPSPTRTTDTACAGLSNIAAATGAFNQLFGKYAFSIHQHHWFASVIRDLVAGRAPPPPSDEEVRELLPPAVRAGDTSNNAMLNDDSKSSGDMCDSSGLTFMSPEHLIAAHAQLKACYDEKLQDIRQQIAAGGNWTSLVARNYEKRYQSLLARNVSLEQLAETYRITHEADQKRIQEATEHLQVRAQMIDTQRETVKSLQKEAERTETLEKEVERLRALLAQRERCQG